MIRFYEILDSTGALTPGLPGIKAKGFDHEATDYIIEPPTTGNI